MQLTKIFYLTTLLSLLVFLNLHGQSGNTVSGQAENTQTTANSTTPANPKTNKKESVDYNHLGIGAGIGLNYGGVGGNLTLSPHEHFALTVQAGYNSVQFNGGAGVNIYILPRTKIYRPNIKLNIGQISALNGYNINREDKTYYGFVPGIGNELRFGKSRKFGFDFDLLFPVKSETYKDDLKVLKADPNILVIDDWTPVRIALSMHYDF